MKYDGDDINKNPFFDVYNRHYKRLLGDPIIDTVYKPSIDDFLFNQRVNIIVALTVEYHTRCEQYDRTVCRGWSDRDNCAMPVNAYERMLISKHAKEVLQELYDILDGNWYGLTRKDLRKAISSYKF